MSIKSWKKEFYPVPASEVKDAKEAIKHSLKKWKGLLPDALERHKITLNVTTLMSGRSEFEIGGESCALCLISTRIESLFGDCRKCPLFENLGHRCDMADDRPWVIFQNTGNPKPMIAALNKTLKEYKEKK